MHIARTLFQSHISFAYVLITSSQTIYTAYTLYILYVMVQFIMCALASVPTRAREYAPYRGNVMRFRLGDCHSCDDYDVYHINYF